MICIRTSGTGTGDKREQDVLRDDTEVLSSWIGNHSTKWQNQSNIGGTGDFKTKSTYCTRTVLCRCKLYGRLYQKKICSDVYFYSWVSDNSVW